MTRIANLLADREAQRVYLVELAPRDGDGDVAVQRFCGGATDPFFGGYFWESITTVALNVQAGLSDSLIGAADQSGFGTVALGLADRRHDDLADLFWGDASVTVRVGGLGFDLSEFAIIFSGTAADAEWDESSFTVTLRDFGWRLQGAVQTAVLAGTGGIEGGADVKGTLLPIPLGAPRNVSPILVDRAQWVYRIAEGPTGSVVEVRDRGLPLTNAGTSADVYDWTQVPGSYVVDTAHGVLRLGAPPEGSPTVDLIGVPAARRTFVDQIRWLATRAGIAYDVDALIAIKASRPWNASLYLKGDETYLDCIDQLFRSGGCWWGWTPDGRLTGSIVAIRDAADTPIAAPYYSDLKRVATTPPAWRVTVQYGKNWTVQSEDDLGLKTAANTLAVGDLSADQVNQLYEDFSAGNNRNPAAIAAPVFAADGTAIDHVANTDGSIDLIVRWSWPGTDADIDGFELVTYRGATGAVYVVGTDPAGESALNLAATQRSAIFRGLAADGWYTVGIVAYRRVDADVAAAGVILSPVAQPSAVGESPYLPSAHVNYTGQINGAPAGALANKDSIAAADIPPGTLLAELANTWSGTLALTASWQDVVSITGLTIAAAGDTLIAGADADFGAVASGGQTISGAQFRVVDGSGTVLLAPRNFLDDETPGAVARTGLRSLPIQAVTNPGAGAATIKLQAQHTGTATVSLTRARLTVQDRRAS